MSKHTFLAASMAVATVMWAPIIRAEGPVHNDNLIPFYRDVRGAMCDPIGDAVGMITANTPLSTPLFNHNRGPSGMAAAPCNPVLAPDGHQVTLGEFKAVAGRALVSCINTGTNAVIHFSGLQPKGTYTVWLFKVNPSPPPPYLAAGTLGATALSENHFVASDSGEGQISRTTPDQDLSAFGHIGPCFLDDAAELHLVYHIDRQTYGFLPGPINAWVVTARFFFP